MEIATGDPDLVRAAARGDLDAFAQIIAEHDDDMVRLAMVITQHAEAARDAVQNAWPVAWRKLRSLRDPSRLRPWLMSIAANQARQDRRRDWRRKRSELRSASPASWNTGAGAIQAAVQSTLTSLARSRH